jgi:hypothetical protein
MLRLLSTLLLLPAVATTSVPSDAVMHLLHLCRKLKQLEN